MIPQIRRTITRLGLILVMLMASTPPLWAEVLLADAQAIIMLRVLAYDRRLERSPAANIVIGVAFDAKSEVSKRAAEEMLSTLRQLAATVRVSKKNIRAVGLSFIRAEELAAGLDREKPHVLYVCPGLDAQLQPLTTLTRARAILTLTGVASYVTEGVAVGFVPRQQKAKLLINLPAARAEGADLDPAVLKLAELLKP